MPPKGKRNIGYILGSAGPLPAPAVSPALARHIRETAEAVDFAWRLGPEAEAQAMDDAILAELMGRQAYAAATMNDMTISAARRQAGADDFRQLQLQMDDINNQIPPGRAARVAAAVAATNRREAAAAAAAEAADRRLALAEREFEEEFAAGVRMTPQLWRASKVKARAAKAAGRRMDPAAAAARAAAAADRADIARAARESAEARAAGAAAAAGLARTPRTGAKPPSTPGAQAARAARADARFGAAAAAAAEAVVDATAAAASASRERAAAIAAVNVATGRAADNPFSRPIAPAPVAVDIMPPRRRRKARVLSDIGPEPAVGSLRTPVLKPGTAPAALRTAPSVFAALDARVAALGTGPPRTAADVAAARSALRALAATRSQAAAPGAAGAPRRHRSFRTASTPSSSGVSSGPAGPPPLAPLSAPRSRGPDPAAGVGRDPGSVSYSAGSRSEERAPPPLPGGARRRRPTESEAYKAAWEMKLGDLGWMGPLRALLGRAIAAAAGGGGPGGIPAGVATALAPAVAVVGSDAFIITILLAIGVTRVAIYATAIVRTVHLITIWKRGDMVDAKSGKPVSRPRMVLFLIARIALAEPRFAVHFVMMIGKALEMLVPASKASKAHKLLVNELKTKPLAVLDRIVDKKQDPFEKMARIKLRMGNLSGV